MFVTKKLGPNHYSVASPLDGFEAVGPTVREAGERLQATMAIKRMATNRMRELKALTTVSFDPREGAYVADCRAAGLRVQGFTRQDAWDNFLQAITLVEKARAEIAAAQVGPQTPIVDPDAIQSVSGVSQESAADTTSTGEDLAPKSE